MPKIPLYNQGQGGTVKTATGPLSPRANVGAFTAPGQAQAAFFKKAGEVAYQFGMAEKQAETDKAKRDITALVNQSMNDWTNNNTDTTVEGYQASAAAEKERLRTSALESMRGSLTRRQFAEVSGAFDTTFATKLAQGSQIAFSKNQAVRTESADAFLDNAFSELISLNPESDLYKQKFAEVNAQYDGFIGQGIKPTKYANRTAFAQSLDAGVFSRSVETATTQAQIDELRSQTAQRTDLSGPVFAARNNALNAQEKVVQAELAEGIFNELTTLPDTSRSLQTKEGLEEVITSIRNGETKEYTTPDGEVVSFSFNDVKSGTKETLIARLRARYDNVQSQEQNALLVSLDSTLYDENTTLADVVRLQEQLDQKTGLFAGMDDIAQINQARTLLDKAQAEKARMELAGAAQSQGDLIASIAANKGVVDNEDEALLAKITSVYNMADRPDLAFELSEAVAVEKQASSLFQEYQFASPERKNEIMDAASKNQDTDVGKRTFESLQAKAAAAKKEMESDFVRYYMNARDLEEKPSVSQLITIQRNLGIAEQDIRIASNAEINDFRNNYDAAETYQQKAEEGQKFLSRFGNEQNRVVQHLLKTGAISKVDNLVMAYPTDVGMKAVHIYNQPDMVKTYKSDLQKDVRDVVFDQVTDLIGDYSSSIVGGITNDVLGGGMTKGRASHIFEMRDIVLNTAQGYIATGLIKDPEQAAEQAYKDVIGNHFDFHEIGNKSTSQIRFEKGAYQYAEEMVSVLDISLTMNQEYLRTIVQAPPPPQGASLKKADALENAYFNELAQFGSWRTTTDNKSVYLVDQLGNVVTRKDATGQDAFITIPLEKLAPLGTEYAKMGTQGEESYVPNIGRRRNAMLQKLLAGQLF